MLVVFAPRRAVSRTSRRPVSRAGSVRPRWQPSALAAVTLLIIAAVGALLISLNVRNVRRIETIQGRLATIDRVRVLRQRLQTSLLTSAGIVLPPESYIVEDIRLQIEEALALGDFLDPATATRLEDARQLLMATGFVSTSIVLRALELLGQVSDAEMEAQRELLGDVTADARRELWLGVTALVALTAFVLVAGWLRTGKATLQREVRTATATLLAQQRALADSERLAAVGEMAATVAHELRNPLAGALASVENLRRSAEPEAAERLGRVASELGRVVDRLKTYLGAAAHRPETPVPTEIGALTDDLLHLLRHQMPPGVRLEADFAGPLRCRVPPQRLRQALMNLVLNAAEAMGDRGGRIVVEGRSVEGELRLSVLDEGPGLPRELLDSGPVAFSTSRASGTGLGLAIVERTMRDLGGGLELANRERGGARVTLRAPCGADGKGTDA